MCIQSSRSNCRLHTVCSRLHRNRGGTHGSPCCRGSVATIWSMGNGCCLPRFVRRCHEAKANAGIRPAGNNPRLSKQRQQ